MGNCCDRFEDRNIYDDGDTERRPLLGVDGTARGGDGAGSTSPGGVKPDFGGGGGGASHEKGERKNDEQSALNRILQTTADQVRARVRLGAIRDGAILYTYDHPMLIFSPRRSSTWELWIRAVWSNVTI